MKITSVLTVFYFCANKNHCTITYRQIRKLIDLNALVMHVVMTSYNTMPVSPPIQKSP